MSRDEKKRAHSDQEVEDLLSELEEIVTREGIAQRVDRHDIEDIQQQVVGGFAFFLSLAAILPTGLAVAFITAQRINTETSPNLLIFSIAVAVGSILGTSMIRGHTSVLIHEFKHSLISNLVGNKRKGMRVDEHSGHFEYAYTKKTEHFNAFIALAPYIVPVFTFLGSLMAFTVFHGDHNLALVLVGCGFGVDLALNIRDISPIQTDLSLIRGGYRVGLTYVIAWNVLVAGLLIAWALEGVSGLIQLLEAVSLFFLGIHRWYHELKSYSDSE